MVVFFQAKYFISFQSPKNKLLTDGGFGGSTSNLVIVCWNPYSFGVAAPVIDDGLSRLSSETVDFEPIDDVGNGFDPVDLLHCFRRPPFSDFLAATFFTSGPL